MAADKSPSEIEIKNYQAVIIPAARRQAADKMRTKPEMVKLVKDAVKNGLVAGAICHAARMLIEADAVRWLEKGYLLYLRQDRP